MDVQLVSWASQAFDRIALVDVINILKYIYTYTPYIIGLMPYSFVTCEIS